MKYQPTNKLKPQKNNKNNVLQVSIIFPQTKSVFFLAKLSHKEDSLPFQVDDLEKALLFESGGPDTEYVIREAAIGKPPFPPSLSSRVGLKSQVAKRMGTALEETKKGVRDT